jgi:hypothetical protein
MGFSFHATGRVKRTEECRSQNRTINDRSPRPAAKTKEKPAGMNRRVSLIEPLPLLLGLP